MEPHILTSFNYFIKLFLDKINNLFEIKTLT